MKILNYKNHRIETIRTEDSHPIYICIINGMYYTAGIADENEEKVIENAKAEIDKQLKNGMKTYKIGFYKAGQQFAREVFCSHRKKEIKKEFIRIFKETDFCPEGSDNQPRNAEIAWKNKFFSEDVNYVGVFLCENGDDTLRTIYSNQGIISNEIR